MKAFELEALRRGAQEDGVSYVEFHRAPTMSCGVYRLPAGGTDPQGPHTEDEIYVVIEGRARIRVAQEDRAVRPGTVLFVGAGVDHRFHGIAEDLLVLVVFAPPEGTVSRGPTS